MIALTHHYSLLVLLLGFFCSVISSSQAVPGTGFSFVTIINSVNYLPVTISSDGKLRCDPFWQDAEATCFVMFMSSLNNGISSAAFGQTVNDTNYMITALSDGSVMGRSSLPPAVGSGDGLEGYTDFSFNFEEETQLKMTIQGKEMCLSFRDSDPIMVDCSNGMNFFTIMDGC